MFLTEGYPWPREIAFAQKLANKYMVANGFIRRNQSWWHDVRNELALKLLSIEPNHPEIADSKYRTEGKLNPYVVQVCRNYIADIHRRAKNPLDYSQSLTPLPDENGEGKPGILDSLRADSETEPDSRQNIRRAVFEQARKRLPARESVALMEHELGLPPSSGLSVRGQQKLLQRARERLLTIIARIEQGVEPGGPFYAVSPVIEIAHELAIAARKELFPGWKGREWPVPPHCQHGVQRLNPPVCCSVCQSERESKRAYSAARYVYRPCETQIQRLAIL
jgi:DNA-directed RNA polymerase specialized sigma24 family protein